MRIGSNFTMENPQYSHAGTERTESHKADDKMFGTNEIRTWNGNTNSKSQTRTNTHAIQKQTLNRQR